MKNDELQGESTDSSSTAQPVFAMDLLSDPDREFREWLIVGHLKANLTGLDELRIIGINGTFKPAA
jgi:hypothetical protein